MDFEEFNKRIVVLRPTLMEAAKHMNGNDASAEDLVQEVMLKLWSMRQQLDRHPNPKALALNMLRHKIIDEQRHKQLEYGRPTAEPSSEETTRHVERQDELRLIGEIINRLPALQAQVLRLKDIEGYETEEIASITGASPENIRQCLSRARKTIRQEFIKMTIR